MELIGLKVKHTTFGVGVITEMEGHYITVEFTSKTSKFVYPDAFEKFIKAEDPAVQQAIADEINGTKAAATLCTMTSGRPMVIICIPARAKPAIRP